MRRQEECFGKYLRSIRMLRGLKVDDMAAQAGVSEVQWDLWESSSQLPCAREIDELVRRLDLSPYKHERMAYLVEIARAQPCPGLKSGF